MDIIAIAMGAQVKVLTLGTAEKNASNARLLTPVTDNVRMSYANLCVVNNNQIVLTLIADTVVCSMTRVPINDNRLLRRMSRAWSANFTQRANVTFTAVYEKEENRIIGKLEHQLLECVKMIDYFPNNKKSVSQFLLSQPGELDEINYLGTKCQIILSQFC